MPKLEFPVAQEHFDETFKLDTLPDFFECAGCMSIYPDILECPKCSAHACQACVDSYSAAPKKAKAAEFPTAPHFKCLLCNNIT